MDIDNDRQFDDLSPQMRRFCREYIKDGNGTRSAIEAGYAENAAANTAYRLLKRDDVRAYLAAMQAGSTSSAIATYEETCEILSRYLRRLDTDPAIDVKGNVHNVPIHSREVAKIADVFASIRGWKTDNIHLQSDNTVQFIDDLTQGKSKSK